MKKEVKELLNAKKTLFSNYKSLEKQLDESFKEVQYYTKKYKEAKSYDAQLKADNLRRHCGIRYLRIQEQMEKTIQLIKKADIQLSVYNSREKYNSIDINNCYTLIVGSLLYLVDNYNKTCMQNSMNLNKYNFNGALKKLIMLNNNKKELSDEKIDALKDSVAFLNSYVQKAYNANPSDANYKEVDKDPVFNLLQRATGESKYTKDYFLNYDIEKFNAEEFSK